MSTVERTSSPTSTPAAQGAQTSTTGTHRIERGDTLSELAQRYGTTVEAFMRANPQIRDADLILVMEHGDIVEIRALIAHPMETGFRVAADGKRVPRDILRRFAENPGPLRK